MAVLNNRFAKFLKFCQFSQSGASHVQHTTECRLFTSICSAMFNVENFICMSFVLWS